MSQDNSQEAKWYVAHTYSGYENKVAKSLEAVIENRRLHDLIQDIKVPSEILVEVKDGKRKETEVKLFPSYVFVKMVLTDETWYIVRNTRGVTGFVGSSSSKPSPLPQKEVDAMGVETVTQTIDFKVGDNVEITQGPLQGFIGVVDEIDTDNDKVKVKVSMFGRETVSEVELLQVKPI
ncbi:MAG: transcription termination/antitermination protein NusG [Oscillospiraceae bacterium]